MSCRELDASRIWRILRRHTPAWYVKSCEYLYYTNYKRFMRRTMYDTEPSIAEIVSRNLSGYEFTRTARRYTLYGQLRRGARRHHYTREVVHTNGGRCRLYGPPALADELRAGCENVLMYDTKSGRVFLYEKK